MKIKTVENINNRTKKVSALEQLKAELFSVNFPYNFFL